MATPEPPGGPRDVDAGAADPRAAAAAWDDLSGTVPYRPPWATDQPAERERTPAAPPREVSAERFARDAEALGLVDAATLQDAVGRLRPEDAGRAEPLARELVRVGKLTSYQAGALLQGKARGLDIGTYLVLDRLGAGGMGLVFKAWHRRLKRVVALKVLPPSVSRDPATVQRFHREAEAAAHLSHPHIVAALDADEFKGLHFLVMEFVEGRDLGRLVAEEGSLPVGTALAYTIQAARGLGEAHARGVFHRDVKPSNLLLDVAGTVKVSDLGLARLDPAVDRPGGPAAGASELTRDGAMMGTVDFMPPEQAYNFRTADHRSDIYSLGCTLYYLIVGRVPYPAETLMGRLLAHREVPLPAVRDDLPDAPPALDAVLRKMTAKDPAARHATVAELIADLEAVSEGREPPSLPVEPPAEVVAPVPPTPTPPPPISRKVLGVMALVLVLSAAALVLDRRRVRTGEVSVRGDDRVSTLTVRRDGVTVLGPTKSRLLRLPPGVYEVELDPARPGFRLNPERVRVVLGEMAVTRIEPTPPDPKEPTRPASPTPDPTPAVEQPPAAPPEPPAPESVGLLRTLEHGGGPVQAVAVSADGRLAVSGGSDRRAIVWNFRDGTPLARVTHSGPVFAVALLPDGRVASAGSDPEIRVWKADSGEVTASLGGHTRKVNALAPQPGGDLLLSGSDDGTARLWDTDNLVERQRFRHGGSVLAVGFTQDGRRAVTAGADRAVVVWDVATGAEAARFTDTRVPEALAVTADGRLITGGRGGGLTVFAVDTPGQAPTVEADPSQWVRSLAVRPADEILLVGEESGALRMVAPGNGGSAPFDNGPGARLGVAVAADGVHAATADEDGRVRLWRLPGPGAGAGPQPRNSRPR